MPKKLLAHVNNLIPNLMQTGISANNVVKSTSDVVYQAIIPAGATLTNSKSMNGAVRGIYHGNNGIQGQANFVAVNQSSQVIANSVSTGINITSMIVGQYYMAQINSELAKINDEITSDKKFEVKDNAGNIHTLNGMKFQYIRGIDTPVSFMKRLNELYKEGMKEYLNKDVIDYNDEEIKTLYDKYNGVSLFKKNKNFICIE